MQTSRKGIFACGNVVHVNDLVDNVSTESSHAGEAAALYAMGRLPASVGTAVSVSGHGIRYVCPQRVAISEGDCPVRLYFRVLAPGGKTALTARCGDRVLATKIVQRVSPGEMEHLDLNAAELAEKEITVEAEEAR